MIAFYWREHQCNGAQVVAGPFATAKEAGEWRRDHPPLIDANGPTLFKLVNLREVPLDSGEYAACFTAFAHQPEPRMDLSAESVRMP